MITLMKLSTRIAAVAVSVAVAVPFGLTLPASAATVTILPGVQTVGVIAIGANGASYLGQNYSSLGGRGAAVTAVVSSNFSVGDTITTTVGTGGTGSPGGGGGLTLVTNTTASTDLVIAGGGGGGGDGFGFVTDGGDAGQADGAGGAGSAGAVGDALAGGGGVAGVGGSGGVGDNTNGAAGGAVNGGDGLYSCCGLTGGKGAIGSTGGGSDSIAVGGGGGAGYGGGGGGGSGTVPGEGGGASGGGGGAGGSFSLSSTRVYESGPENTVSNGAAGSAAVLQISQSTLATPTVDDPTGEVTLTWDAPGVTPSNPNVSAPSYEVVRDDVVVGDTTGTSFVDRPGAGTHTYSLISTAVLNTPNGIPVGDLITNSTAVTSAEVPLIQPTVTEVSPASIPAAGGSAVTIAGTGFLDNAVVTIGGQPCTNVAVNSAGTSITCTAPAGTVGVADVNVTNPDNGTATKVSAVTYTSGTPATLACPISIKGARNANAKLPLGKTVVLAKKISTVAGCSLKVSKKSTASKRGDLVSGVIIKFNTKTGKATATAYSRNAKATLTAVARPSALPYTTNSRVWKRTWRS